MFSDAQGEQLPPLTEQPSPSPLLFFLPFSNLGPVQYYPLVWSWVPFPEKEPLCFLLPFFILCSLVSLSLVGLPLFRYSVD